MFFSYCLIRGFTFFFAFLPYKTIHKLGKGLGSLLYVCLPSYRKRALSNLALAPALQLSNLEIQAIAKASLQSLAITCLEYAKLSLEKNLHKIVTCENPEVANDLMANGKGVIFFCGHQANWELLFLEGTTRMKGLAIGRPIKNRYLYQWIQGIRQKFGGKMISPKEAVKEGLKALKQGAFLGIVGDQGLPESSYCSLFLGRQAKTSPLPALLSYKTNTPIIVATTKRANGRYTITYSSPIFPNLQHPMEEEVKRLMDQTLFLFEESVKACPEQWLWIHNRWKVQSLKTIKKPYRQDSLALFLPKDEKLLHTLPLIRTAYPKEQIFAFVPKHLSSLITLDIQVIPYQDLEEVLRDDLRFKLIINFTKNPKIASYYKKKAAQSFLEVDSFEELLKEIKNA